MLNVELVQVGGFPQQSHATEGDDLDALLAEVEQENSAETQQSHSDPGKLLDNIRDTERLRREALPRFCRHCGVKLADYSDVGNACPSCGRNLFGD